MTAAHKNFSKTLEAKAAPKIGKADDDLDGTVQEEKIYHMAGADTPQAMTRSQLVRLIREAGRTAVERDTLYNVRWVDDGSPLEELRLDSSVPYSGHTHRPKLPVIS